MYTEAFKKSHEIEVIKKTKSDMTILWGICYYTWVYKFVVYNHSDDPGVKIRIIHPIWFILILLALIYWIALEWLLDRCMYREIKEHTCII